MGGDTEEDARHKTATYSRAYTHTKPGSFQDFLSHAIQE